MYIEELRVNEPNSKCEQDLCAMLLLPTATSPKITNLWAMTFSDDWFIFARL
jgi:hypothetical protein